MEGHLKLRLVPLTFEISQGGNMRRSGSEPSPHVQEAGLPPEQLGNCMLSEHCIKLITRAKIIVFITKINLSILRNFKNYLVEDDI